MSDVWSFKVRLKGALGEVETEQQFGDALIRTGPEIRKQIFDAAIEAYKALEPAK